MDKRPAPSSNDSSSSDDDEDDWSGKHPKLEDEKPPGPPPIIIDPCGKLFLPVGRRGNTFQVDVMALRRASPVLNDDLSRDGSVFTAGPGEPVLLTDADPGAMEVILNIVHARFDRVPEFPDVILLYNITIVAEQLKMLNVLRPWANSWAGILDDGPALESLQNGARGIYVEDLQRLSSFFHLRKITEFVKWFVSVVARTEKSPGGHLLCSSPDGADKVLWRHALGRNSVRLIITSHAIGFREDALQHLVNTLDEMSASALDANESHLSKSCSREFFIIIQEHLNCANLPRSPTVRDIRVSPAALSQILFDILSDITWYRQTQCQCRKIQVVDGVEYASYTMCVFPPQNLTLLKDYCSESLSEDVTKKFREVFSIVAKKMEPGNCD